LPFCGGIQINKNIIALTSNKIISKGKDKLIFYHLYGKKICETIEGFSHILSINSLTLLPISRKSLESQDKMKYLVCACKKYSKNQKNGILFIKINFINKNDIKIKDKYFYETGNFEVYCFCPIYNITNNNNINFNKKIKKKRTRYFLVGGFDKIKGRGLIQLYKIINNGNKLKISYINNVGINENNSKSFQGYIGPITCIIQSNNDGKIIASCYDEKIYLFEKPNLNFKAI